MLSQSGAVLNRFPGLELKAWALVTGGVIRKSFNVASVSVPPGGVGGVRLTYAQPVAGACICDVTAAGQWMVGSGSTAAYADIFFYKPADGSNYTGSADCFVAVYGQ